MSEEIIIDGVNVAECEHRSDTHNNLLADGTIKKFSNYCYITNDGCYGVNCYYKQLKRLQAENELLKDANAHLKTELKQRYDEPDFESFRLMGKTIDEWKQLWEENKRLQAENEELKKQIEKQKNAKVQLKNLDSRFADDYCKVKAENEQLKALCDTYFTCYRAKHNDIEGNLFSYRKALEEIKEIADLIVNDEDKPSCVNDDDCPLNDGDGLDNHCDMNCPYILGKHIQDKISEVLDER